MPAIICVDLREAQVALVVTCFQSIDSAIYSLESSGSLPVFLH